MISWRILFLAALSVAEGGAFAQTEAEVLRVELEGKIEALTTQVDRDKGLLNSRLDDQSVALKSQADQVHALQGVITDVQGLRIKLKDDAHDLEVKMKTVEAGIETARNVEKELQAFKQKVEQVNRDSEWSKSFVSWMAAVVSVLVILVSLFFSKSFMELYADYKVLAALRERDEKDAKNGEAAVEDRDHFEAAPPVIPMEPVKPKPRKKTVQTK